MAGGGTTTAGGWFTTTTGGGVGALGLVPEQAAANNKSARGMRVMREVTYLIRNGVGASEMRFEKRGRQRGQTASFAEEILVSRVGIEPTTT